MATAQLTELLKVDDLSNDPFIIYHARSSETPNMVFISAAEKVLNEDAEPEDLVDDWDLAFTNLPEEWDSPQRFKRLWRLISDDPATAYEAKWESAMVHTLDKILDYLIRMPDADPEWVRDLAQETFNKGLR